MGIEKVRKQLEKTESAVKNESFLKEEILTNVIQDYTTRKSAMLINMKKGVISKEEFLDDVRQHIRRLYTQEEEKISLVMDEFEQFVFGYSRLTPLINDPRITDIRCISYDNIRIKVGGRRENSGVSFSSEKEYRQFIDYVATRNQVSIANVTAIQCFTDMQSSPDYILRFTITMPLVNTYDEPYLCIRKVPKNFPEIDTLIRQGVLTRSVADILVERFRKGSMLICGANSSGKTTILNALKETLPVEYAVLVIQQADELTTKRHPDMMFLHSLPKAGESNVTFDLAELSLAGLTMDIDYFIIGEVKGAEAIYLLNAAYTGQICAATIHAPGAEKGINKLVDYALYNSRYTRDELMQMMACWNTVVYMEDYRVSQVYEVKGWNQERHELEYQPVYEER